MVFQIKKDLSRIEISWVIKKKLSLSAIYYWDWYALKTKGIWGCQLFSNGNEKNERICIKVLCPWARIREN
jgi:hypothetical protein